MMLSVPTTKRSVAAANARPAPRICYLLEFGRLQTRDERPASPGSGEAARVAMRDPAHMDLKRLRQPRRRSPGRWVSEAILDARVALWLSRLVWHMWTAKPARRRGV